MSVWNEIRKRGTGAEIKKEDEVQEENLWSFAEGIGNVAIGMNSHAEGIGSVATGMNSHAEGIGNVAIGMNSHAEVFTKQIDQLKKQQVQLSGRLSDLRRELDAFRWNKKKYTKCNYKI